MARKDERRKAGVGGRKSSAKPGAERRAGVAKRAAPKTGAKSAAKLAASPPPPPTPKVKFRGRLLEHEPLARYTTYRLGGPARYFLMPADVEDVAKGIEFANERRLPWLAIGLGSNLLVKESGFPGLGIRVGKGLDRFEMKGAIAIVGAGMPTPILARRTAEGGFAGVERFIGIPGTVGGGVYMNAGAHGAEFAEVITEVSVMDGKGKIRQLARKQISFKYRASNLGDVVVLETKLLLLEEAPAKLKELQGKLLRWRKAGTPFDQPCAGSVFKNPGGAKTAGTLIDECGLKGYTIGGAQVSTMHANYFVNTGTATPSDVLRLIEHVRKTVQKKTGVELELEVKVIG